MTKLFAVLFAGFIATSSFAASHVGAPMAAASAGKMEAQKVGDPKAEAAAQSKVDARVQSPSKSAMQPEAQMSGSTKVSAKKHHKAKIGKKNSTDAQMSKDAAKL